MGYVLYVSLHNFGKADTVLVAHSSWVDRREKKEAKGDVVGTGGVFSSGKPPLVKKSALPSELVSAGQQYSGMEYMQNNTLQGQAGNQYSGMGYTQNNGQQQGLGGSHFSDMGFVQTINQPIQGRNQFPSMASMGFTQNNTQQGQTGQQSNMAAFIQGQARQQVSSNMGPGLYPTPNLSLDDKFNFLGGNFSYGNGQSFNEIATTTRQGNTTEQGKILGDEETPITTDSEGDVNLMKELFDE